MVSTSVKTFGANFDSSKFQSDIVDYAYISPVNSNTEFGFFLRKDQAELVNFKPNKDWKPFTRTYNNGESQEGFICRNPKMVILHQGSLGMYEKGDNGSDGRYLGSYDETYYRINKGLVSLKTPFLIMLVDSNYQLLHDQPLKYTARGVFGTNFAKTVSGFRQATGNAYKKVFNTSARPKPEFSVLVVLELTLNKGQVGDKQKSWSTVIDSYTIPTAENLAALHINPEGGESATEAKILELYQAHKNFDKKSLTDKAEEYSSNEADKPVEIDWETCTWYDVKDDDTVNVSAFLVKKLNVSSLVDYKAYIKEFMEANNIESPSGRFSPNEVPDDLVDSLLESLQ